MSSARHIVNLGVLDSFPIICLTGGEPMLYPGRVLYIVKELRIRCPNSKIYMYTAMYNQMMWKVMEALDGMQYTLHYPCKSRDITMFELVQSLIRIDYREGVRKSYRLYIDSRVENMVSIIPKGWTRVQMHPWLTEDQLLEKDLFRPDRETLYYYEE